VSIQNASTSNGTKTAARVEWRNGIRYLPGVTTQMLTINDITGPGWALSIAALA
jgi:hypothetical protein